MTTTNSSGVTLLAWLHQAATDRISQQLRCSDFFGYWLTVSSQAGDVNLDRLDGALQAFLDGAATGEAPGERRDDTKKPPSSSGSTTIVQVLISFILSQHGAEFIGADTCLIQDRPK